MRVLVNILFLYLDYILHFGTVCAISFPMHEGDFPEEPQFIIPNCEMQSILFLFKEPEDSVRNAVILRAIRQDGPGPLNRKSRGTERDKDRKRCERGAEQTPARASL